MMEWSFSRTLFKWRCLQLAQASLLAVVVLWLSALPTSMSWKLATSRPYRGFQTVPPLDSTDKLEPRDCKHAIATDFDTMNRWCRDVCQQLAGFGRLLSEEENSTTEDPGHNARVQFFRRCQIVRSPDDAVMCFSNLILGVGRPDNPYRPWKEIPPGVVEADSMASCQGQCQENAFCAYFSFDEGSQHCILYSQGSLDELFFNFRSRFTSSSSSQPPSSEPQSEILSSELTSEVQLGSPSHRKLAPFTTLPNTATSPLPNTATPPLPNTATPPLPNTATPPLPNTATPPLPNTATPPSTSRAADMLPTMPCDEWLLAKCITEAADEFLPRKPASCLPECTGIYACMWKDPEVSSGPRRCSEIVDLTCPPVEFKSTPNPDPNDMSRSTRDPRENTSSGIPPTGVVVAVCIGAVLFVAISGAFWQFSRILVSIRTSGVTSLESPPMSPVAYQRQSAPVSFERYPVAAG